VLKAAPVARKPRRKPRPWPESRARSVHYVAPESRARSVHYVLSAAGARVHGTVIGSSADADADADAPVDADAVDADALGALEELVDAAARTRARSVSETHVLPMQKRPDTRASPDT
jgi:hypothetical protein